MLKNANNQTCGSWCGVCARHATYAHAMHTTFPTRGAGAGKANLCSTAPAVLSALAALVEVER
eukprot:m.206955 g.206955  ORF g.206955 m.206955 type:complete len:63 (+) comp18911_c0_seq1:68-256(+)